MFERFTTRARKTVVDAQEESRELGHGSIDTDHLLLGLLDGDEASIARAALTRLGVTAERSRQEVASRLGAGGSTPSGHIPFTKSAKKVLELSLREALSLGHNYIGTEHILLGVVREGSAMPILTVQGATAERVRAEVRAGLAGVGATGDAAAPSADLTPGAEGVLATARELAAGGPMGTQHLLEALAMADGSVAAAVIADLGVDVDDLTTRLDGADVDGTTDLTPELVATRQMEVHRDGDAVRIVFGDETVRQLVARLTESVGEPIRGADGDVDALTTLWRANVAALQAITARLSPAGDDTPAGQERTATMRAAIRRRLRRRDR